MAYSGRILLSIVVIGLAVVIPFICRQMVRFGVFSHYYQHYPGPCKLVPGMPLSSEDFYTLPNGLTFISSVLPDLMNFYHTYQDFVSGVIHSAGSDDFRLYFQQNNIRGRMFLYDLKFPEKAVKELAIVSTKTFEVDAFSPHGISVWEDKVSGHHTVFVVNHPRKESTADTVEKFVYVPDKKQLKHVATFSAPELRWLNDVQATSDNSFYVTNFYYSTTFAFMMLESLLSLPWTSVVYYDGNSYKVVAGGIRSANGVAMSNDQKYVYVAASGGLELLIFKKEKDYSLTLKQAVPLYTLPDNIIVDPKTEDLYIACHPLPLKLIMYLHAPIGKTSPSQVLHLRMSDGNVSSIQELLYDEGHVITASSTAFKFANKLLVSSVIEKTIVCDVNVSV